MSTDRQHWLNPLHEGERGPDAKGMFMWVTLAGGAVWDVWQGRSHPLWVAWPAVIASATLYLGVIHQAFANRRRAERLFLPALAVVCLSGAAAFGDNWLYLLPMLSIAIGTTVRHRGFPVFTLGVCVAAALIVTARGGGIGDALLLCWGIFTAGIIPAIIIRLWEAIRELQRTREELARAAVTEERLRFSRDLHDLLGHTLSVMVVKAEVVRRLAAADPGTAARQAADIEEIGRRALTEVRTAVTGYRGRGLAAELETARTVLGDAGLRAVIRAPVVRLAPETDALLGWAVREGVTNVIRHSGAGSCEINLRDGDGLVLEIRDDGGPAAPSRSGRGNGLTGLRERVAAVGGSMEAGPLPRRGFLLRVVVPDDEEGRA
ncbi:sensor histidine kinase [Microbispora sp. ATCC PTA-5024]|uniref:sensor histidine kinase n=1 Tax=Microbispora sp. ATCC PTA-5024 TaxID=316330 RepID=UPI0003DC283D|nr:sensor histidine kinase [Microbispora sp. ATCC PTA-5024]ETK37546.1 histidine kinase [Microbispora sp. ATCC PTA-5024]